MPQISLAFQQGHAKAINGLAFAPGGRYLAGASEDGEQVKLWEVASARLIRGFRARASALCVAFSPDGRLLASGHFDNGVRIWEAATGRVQRVLKGQTAGEGEYQAINAVTFSPDGQLLASASGSTRVELSATGSWCAR